MLRCGDVLTHVDEQFVVGAPSNLVVPRLLGPCGTEVKLTFNRRESTCSPHVVPLPLPLPFVS
eukprot:746904-Hanusia_phi.AAC.2